MVSRFTRAQIHTMYDDGLEALVPYGVRTSSDFGSRLSGRAGEICCTPNTNNSRNAKMNKKQQLDPLATVDPTVKLAPYDNLGL